MSLAPSAPDQREPARYRISADEFTKMVEAGIFGEDDHIELLDGELYEMAPQGNWHTSRVRKLNHHIGTQIGRRGMLTVQSSLNLGATSTPEPDLALSGFREDGFPNGVPVDQLLLVIEVADTTIRHDREVKLPLYAAAGIPETWLVTREPARIEVFREPREGVYTQHRIALPGETVSPAAFPDLEIAVSDVVG